MVSVKGPMTKVIYVDVSVWNLLDIILGCVKGNFCQWINIRSTILEFRVSSLNKYESFNSPQASQLSATELRFSWLSHGGPFDLPNIELKFSHSISMSSVNSLEEYEFP